MNYKAPWSGRGHQYTETEVAKVREVMLQADSLTQGCYQKEFEDKFSKFTGSPFSFSLTSCTAALELSAMLSRLAPGDEVIVPAHTFAASAIPFARTGATLRWADIDPKTWIVTAKTIEPLITSKTKVIVVVHLYGLVADMDPINELAKRHGLLVVEDAAQSIGARYKGKMSGALGDFGCFSFHSHKNITTLGEGGALTVKNPELAKVVPGLRHNGMRTFGERELYWEPAPTNVDFDWDGVWPYNFCQGEVQNALASLLLDRVEALNRDRREKAFFFRDALRGCEELQFQEIPESCEHSFHLHPARYTGPGERNNLMKLLSFEYGVRVTTQYYPLYRYPMFKKAGFGHAICPETDRHYDSMVSFPFHHAQSQSEVEHIVESVKLALKKMKS